MPRSWSSTTGNGSSTGLAAASGWTLGDYYQFQVDTAGFQDLAIDWDQARSSTGPGLFDLSYSLDGISFTQTGIPFGVIENADPPGGPGVWNSSPPAIASYNISTDLSSVDALENQPAVYLRIENAMPPFLTPPGTIYLDNVVISGTPMAPFDPFTWINAAGGDFGTGSNWYGGMTPGSGDTPVVDLTANYSVTFGADVTNAGLLFNRGTVTFDLQGNTHTIATLPAEIIGSQVGSGATLELSSSAAGGVAEYQSLNIGSTASGSSGQVVVDGANAELSSYKIDVGDIGTGILNVSGGGTVVPVDPLQVNRDMFLGEGANALGTLNVSGAGSSVSGWTRLWVGGGFFSVTNGHGEVNVSDGGAISGGQLQIANGATSTGAVVVTGAGSSLTGGTVSVGAGGTGSFTIESGADVNVDSIGVGGSNQGTALVQSGGQLETTSTSSVSTIGGNSAGTGQLMVTGSGSQWNASSQIQVGGSGTGHLTVSAGGEVQSDKANSATNLSGLVAVQVGSTGTVTITGAGSQWTQDGGMSVGHRGDGTLDITSRR